MIQLFERFVPSEQKRKPPTRDIKDTPTLHRSMLFFGPGRTIPVIPWPICYSPKAIPVRGLPLIGGPIQPSHLYDDEILHTCKIQIPTSDQRGSMLMSLWTLLAVFPSSFLFLSYVHVVSL